MGLTTWKGGAVQRTDVTVAKNYLRDNEITELNRIVVMFLDYAEDQSRRKQTIHLRDWQHKLDDFLRFNERPILADAGHVSREGADERAHTEFERFAARRRELAEVRGEAENLKALEDLARKLPEHRKGE